MLHQGAWKSCALSETLNSKEWQSFSPVSWVPNVMSSDGAALVASGRMKCSSASPTPCSPVCPCIASFTAIAQYLRMLYLLLIVLIYTCNTRFWSRWYLCVTTKLCSQLWSSTTEAVGSRFAWWITGFFCQLIKFPAFVHLCHELHVTYIKIEEYHCTLYLESFEKGLAWYNHVGSCARILSLNRQTLDRLFWLFWDRTRTHFWF